MKLHLIRETDDRSPRGIYATKKEARADIKTFFWDRDMSIETIEVRNSARAVADFISTYFGKQVFEG